MTFKRTPKQIAAKYKDNLDYYRKPHPFRTVKLLCFLLAAAGSVALVLLPHSTQIYSTGPISANHARFADHCEVCHEGAQPVLSAKLWPAGATLEERTRGLWQQLFQFAKAPSVPAAVHQALAAGSSLAKLDAACLRCHEPMKLHQPQHPLLALRGVRTELAGATVSSCSSCHREHEGPATMPPPPGDNCIRCHGDAELLRQTLLVLPAGGTPPPPTGAVQDFRHDKVRRFIPPQEPVRDFAVFTSFAEGHPAFGYEKPNLRDPAALSFNHSRHLQSDIPPVNGHRLTCTDCHRPGPDGMFMQRVTYQADCSGCHSLHFSSDLPKLAIPHGDPEKVRDTLTSAGLTVLFQDYAVHEKGITDKAQQEAFIIDQFRQLTSRGIGTQEALLARVFRTGDPPNTTNQFFPACAKCHVVNAPVGGATPTIQPTNMADRWLVRGPFNHAPHAHMNCVDCHAAALASSRTTDILLPSQKLCAECHRPLERGQTQAPFQKVESMKLNPELVAQQRRQGGISGDCTYCHQKYHAPADATVFARSVAK